MELSKGRLSLATCPFSIFLTTSIYHVQEELRKHSGENWKRILYESGKADAFIANTSYLRLCAEDSNLKDLLVDKKKGIEFLANQYNKIGKGEVSIKYRPEIPEASCTLKFSPIALEYVEHGGSKEPTCYYFAGVYAGSFSIFNPGAEVTEIKCMAKGDQYCEFVVEIPKK